MNIELPFFHYTDHTCSFKKVKFSACNYPVWILSLAEFPQVRVRTPPFNLLYSLESIQGSSHTTCLLRNNLERPAAKCSSGHSLRTCWCEIPLAIPFYPTDVFPRFMKNWSNSLWLSVYSVVSLGWDLLDIMNHWASSVRKQSHRYLLHVFANSSTTTL